MCCIEVLHTQGLIVFLYSPLGDMMHDCMLLYDSMATFDRLASEKMDPAWQKPLVDVSCAIGALVALCTAHSV